MIFFLQRIELYTIIFCVCVCVCVGGGGGGGGGGMEGVVWQGGSVARVNQFFLQMIQI